MPGNSGSSPRVRGTRSRQERSQRHHRFIPACAGNAWGRWTSTTSRSVHPRVCGERACLDRARERTTGSSPRVRGTPQRTVAAGKVLRFIPACAGNARNDSSSGPNASVHPRVCGERGGRTPVPAAAPGSSPRVRGTPQPHRASAFDARFIPACAGNAESASTATSRPTVHPRVCGERDLTVTLTPQLSGSSPRVRGTPQGKDGRDGVNGFIPACAGNAPEASRCRWPRSVHPRVCGERLDERSAVLQLGGSSPRVRGTRRRPDRFSTGGRFIPACAGNAESHAGNLLPLAGSSPRVRGTRPVRGGDAERQRFIPACAGNARSSPSNTSRATVHPRVCGERTRSARSSLAPYGSSPRVRGTRRSRTRAACPGRFIPACAGNAPARGRWRTRTPVHPRVCGERVRRRGRFPQHRRFIPACAGNAPGRASVMARRSVHPRVCGERRVPVVVPPEKTGSSPRVRGTLRSPGLPAKHRRFIPACAGNARPPAACPPRLPVHPRVCGERLTPSRGVMADAGSSPRVRGTPATHGDERFSSRFIPACAGNAPIPTPSRRTSAVHPRVCGERRKKGGAFLSSNGSSPRVRGTRWPPCSSTRRLTVHPRVCGERRDGHEGTYARDGSSPRVRGTRDAAHRLEGLNRFIPACAGNAARVGDHT